MILAVAATIGALCVLVLLIARPPVGLAALAFFFPFNQFVPFTPLPGLNAETLLVVVAVGMTVLRFGARLPPLRLSGAVFAYILVLLMGLAVTASWYTDWFPLHTNWDNFKNVKHLVLATSFFLTAYWWFRTDRDRRMLLQVFSIGVGAVAAVGILDYFVPLRPRIDSSLVRSVGIFRDPNVLAGYLAAYSLVPLYLIRRRDISGPFRLVCIFIYALAAIDLVLTLSRSGWLAALVGHTVWFGLTDRRLLIAGAFAFVALTSVAYPFLPEVVRDRVEATFEPGTVIFQSGARPPCSVAQPLSPDRRRDGTDRGHGLRLARTRLRPPGLDPLALVEQ
jgi:O-antigen ligase